VSVTSAKLSLSL